MLTLIEATVIALAIGTAEGNVQDLKATKAYYGHQDPCIAAGTCPGRKPNKGMFSIAADSYTPELDFKYFTDMVKYLNSVNTPNKYSFWVLANIADLRVQSPAAVSGWNDSKSKGMGFLKLLDANKPVTDEDIAKLRTNSFFNTTGGNESWTSEPRLYRDQLRRVKALRHVIKDSPL